MDNRTKDLVVMAAFTDMMEDPVMRKVLGLNLLNDKKPNNDLMGAALLLGGRQPTFVNDRFINRGF